MKYIATSIFTLFLIAQSVAQKSTSVSDQFTIEGLVRKTLTITIDSLKKQATVHLDSLVITNHAGVKKSTLRNIKAVPIKQFLDQAEFDVESPKQLSELYFVFIASDGYKVVYSWNEIFNNPIGGAIYLIVERDGLGLDKIEDRISVFSKTDDKTGRRYVKGLSKVVVKRAE
ncbi:hypothetical protein [Runella sp.]|uniref:hypothetical protein n=1 Tax=Runella sp. TaxID=1960881 RepID=UPI0030190A11